jgi:diguanylate cyclase (GGDEF)-like protein/PAS domain S-box-containing protein
MVQEMDQRDGSLVPLRATRAPRDSRASNFIRFLQVPALAAIPLIALAIGMAGWHLSTGAAIVRIVLFGLVSLQALFLSRELSRQLSAHDRRRKEQERRAALLAAVTAAARRMSKLDGDHVLSVVVDAVGAMGFEFANIGLFDEQAEEYRLTHVRGLPDDYAFSVHAATGGLPGLVRDAAQTVVLDDYAGHPRAVEALVAAGVRSGLGTPLWSQGQLAGVLVAGRRDDRPITSMDIEAFELLAAQAGRALENVALAEGLRSSEARFRALVQGSSDLITVVDPDTTIRYQSPPDRILGYSANAMLGLELADMVHPEDAARLRALCTDLASYPGSFMTAEFRAGRSDGSWVHLETTGRNLLDDPNVAGIVLSTRDVTERKALEDQLRHRAFHDPLTNLANRALFKDRVGHALTRTHRRHDRVAVLFLDLDSFKNVNDSLGHAAGDQLLMAVAHRLGNHLRRADTIGRLGGDEFAILLEDVTGARSATHVADGILNVLHAPFTIAGKEVFVNASIGIALSTLVDGADDLLRNADVAMYQAKAGGKGRYCVFESSMHTAAVERLELEADLQRAIDRDELVLDYQPIVDLTTRRLVGVEALVRWDHPERGLLPPDTFIPLAEESGLILAVGRWVLLQACRTVASWQDVAPGLTVSVNLSARHFLHASLIDDVASALRESGLENGLLTVEITESVLMRDSDAVLSKLFELKRLGIRLALDDFGTGYSSLGYLRRFPIDVLKVDKTFVEGIARGVEESAVARAIIKLGRTLRIATVAEGVESAEQVDRLNALHCDQAQGFWFSRPLHVEQVRELLVHREEALPLAVAAT